MTEARIDRQAAARGRRPVSDRARTRKHCQATLHEIAQAHWAASLFSACAWQRGSREGGERATERREGGAGLITVAGRSLLPVSSLAHVISQGREDRCIACPVHALSFSCQPAAIARRPLPPLLPLLSAPPPYLLPPQLFPRPPTSPVRRRNLNFDPFSTSVSSHLDDRTPPLRTDPLRNHRTRPPTTCPRAIPELPDAPLASHRTGQNKNGQKTGACTPYSQPETSRGPRPDQRPRQGRLPPNPTPT